MAGNAKKWFIGCGIGCGLMLLIAGGLGTGGYFMVRRAMDQGEEIEATADALQANYGAPGDFRPDPFGAISADRLETFLAVREAMGPARDEAGSVLLTLHNAETGEGDASTIDKFKAGIRLVPAIIEFIKQRSQAQLDQEMGPGEYLYIYSLAYYAFLDKDPADGPGFQLTGDDDDDDRGFHFTAEAGDFDRARQGEEVRDYLHSIQIQMARTQADGVSHLPEHDAWRTALAAELALMEAEPYRLLWEEGLPEPLRLSFEPYRDRLDDLYDEMTNILDCGMVESD